MTRVGGCGSSARVFAYLKTERVRRNPGALLGVAAWADLAPRAEAAFIRDHLAVIAAPWRLPGNPPLLQRRNAIEPSLSCKQTYKDHMCISS